MEGDPDLLGSLGTPSSAPLVRLGKFLSIQDVNRVLWYFKAQNCRPLQAQNGDQYILNSLGME